MRQIKFRAFWKDTLKEVLDFNEQYLIECLNDDSFIVNQFTGLKDKNKVEIYDGDILSDRIRTDEGIIKSSCQVFRSKGEWRLDISFKQDKSESLNLWLELEDYDYEVIGNIHTKKVE